MSKCLSVEYYKFAHEFLRIEQEPGFIINFKVSVHMTFASENRGQR